MMLSSIDVSLWQKMLRGGYQNLKRNMAVIDQIIADLAAQGIPMKQ
jgi:hypothetical protein